MSLWTCEQCGAQFPDDVAPPAACPICEDDRQFVNWKGQTWLSREQFRASHRLVWRDDLGLAGFAVEPGFAIGQRALLVREADGCVLWDCVPLLTSEAVEHVGSLGGLKAIAVSIRISMARSPTGARPLAACRSICMAMTGSGSQGRILRSSPGQGRAIAFPTASFSSAPADILPAAPSCIGARERKAAAHCSPAISPWRQWTAAL